METTDKLAFGAPGIDARWTSGGKAGVGTAVTDQSHVWFTLSHGILNEVYYPRVDTACIRDMGLIVTDGASFFSEEKRDTDSEVRWLDDAAPAFALLNKSRDGNYVIDKQVVADPYRSTVLQHVRFIPLQGALIDYHLYALLAPHLDNQGNGNDAWVEEFEGAPMLFASRGGSTLAFACSTPWLRTSAGYVGSSDGWQDLKAHRSMAWEFTTAINGNVALTAEVDLQNSDGEFDIAVGFGKDADEAARNATATLDAGFESTKKGYVAGWQSWIGSLSLGANATSHDLSKTSAAVLRIHQSKAEAIGIIASLAIPWGFRRGDNDEAGYHLIWARDMVEAAGGLLAAGAHDDVRRMLLYLKDRQQEDGHWAQNMWIDGTPFWHGIQMDETALPILLVDLAHREKAISGVDIADYWPMVKRAATYLVCNGPVSPQDRWEEDPGYTPFTVAAEIAALLVAADMADLSSEGSVAKYLREIADVWHSSIDRWMFVSDMDWCRNYDVAGYYVRIDPANIGDGQSRFQSEVHVKNVAKAQDMRAAGHLVSTDALALVRFGVRAAEDPRMIDTAKIIDVLLEVNTPKGRTWHRYNGDGYGEHEDGAPFDGIGVGRGWPLLTGERAHYELAAGQAEEANCLLHAMENFANECGLIPEQVWDSPDIPERELHFGRPSGSAMPLVWAHAEYLKLRRSLSDGHVFDTPPPTVQRYLVQKVVSPRIVWRFNHKLRWMPSGKILRIETRAAAIIHWSSDHWSTTQDTRTNDPVLGMHFADLPTEGLGEGTHIDFTFNWPDSGNWEGADFEVRVGPFTPEHAASQGTGEHA